MTGKTTRSALYVHASAVGDLPAAQQARVRRAVRAAGLRPGQYDVVKLRHAGGVSLLAYPGFFSERNPKLHRAWTVSEDGTVRQSDFEGSTRPPILHKKRLMLSRFGR